jgi:hypothetical protein
MLRDVRETPPEIAEAMADAQENPISDEFRAYMAGEGEEPTAGGDEVPERART